ncbi:phospholipase A2 inhibitor and Ly6/PLAUR domain-containing protein-like [Discoglossus pictus]
MKTYLSIVCIISSFIVEGTCLMCESYTTIDGTPSSGHPVNCSTSVTSCMSSVMVISTDKTNITIVEKSCSTIPWICELSYTMNLDIIHMRAKAKCCDSDMCNKEVPKVAPKNDTKNGMQCNYCFEEGLNDCKSVRLMNCTGLQSKCIKFSGRLSTGGIPAEVSYQGCVTPNVCLYTAISSLPKGYQMSCSNPTFYKKI